MKLTTTGWDGTTTQECEIEVDDGRWLSLYAGGVQDCPWKRSLWMVDEQGADGSLKPVVIGIESSLEVAMFAAEEAAKQWLGQNPSVATLIANAGRLIDIEQISEDEFPLNFARYNHIMDELRAAARGFERLAQMGWPGGNNLDHRLMFIRHQLGEIWGEILETEAMLRSHRPFRNTHKG